MKAVYTGACPGYIDIDLGGESMTVSMDRARELLTSLEEALREAEDGMPTLLPCPFCGGEAAVCAMMPRPEVACLSCVVRMTAGTWEKVVTRWNGRTGP